MATNEQKGLDAVIAPSKMTLAALARLERIKSPLLSAQFDSLTENLKAIWAAESTTDDFYAHVDEAEKMGVKLGETLTREDYNAKLDALCKSLVEFGVLMPRPDEDAKKNGGSETGG